MAILRLLPFFRPHLQGFTAHPFPSLFIKNLEYLFLKINFEITVSTLCKSLQTLLQTNGVKLKMKGFLTHAKSIKLYTQQNISHFNVESLIWNILMQNHNFCIISDYNILNKDCCPIWFCKDVMPLALIFFQIK